MAWFTRFTRFGDMHFVYGQEHDMTCGVAAALMCVMKINKLTPGKAALFYETQVAQAYANWLGQAYDPDAEGTYPEGLVSVLNQMNCGRWTQEIVAPADSVDRIVSQVGKTSAFSGPMMRVNPVIIAVDWDGSQAAHWVVIDSIRTMLGSAYATVCDPWDASVHITPIKAGQQFVYEAAPTISFDVWGKRNSYEGAEQTGRVRTWPMIYRV